MRIFDYFSSHRGVRYISLAVVTMLMLAMVARLGYKEDISDFLPLEGRNATAMKAYQQISAGDRIFAILGYQEGVDEDPDMMVEAVDGLVERLDEMEESWRVENVVSQIDWDNALELVNFIYENVPYFLTEADYQRIDSLLAVPGYVGAQIRADKQQLMLPLGGMVTTGISHDPLDLYSPVIRRLQYGSGQMRYGSYEGYIFSPDMKRSIVMMDTPFGSSETEGNRHLVAGLNEAAAGVMEEFPGVDIRFIGNATIAVGNAGQIKKDSLLSVIIAMVLILSLLFYVFRSGKDLLLIALSVAWGWFFALAGLALVHDRVSIIVIGISSIVLGIAVNYPLHMVLHLSHGGDRRTALKELVSPLLVGNITTIGAFLTLVPLSSVALRDLGLFAAFLLGGTIIFVLIYLPHMGGGRHRSYRTFIDRLGEVEMENKRWLIVAIVVLTVVFGLFSTRTEFDSNMSHINYITDQEREDLAYFQEFAADFGDVEQVYVMSSGGSLDEALEGSRAAQEVLDSVASAGLVLRRSGCAELLPSSFQQGIRLTRWSDFVERYGERLRFEIGAAAQQEGFSEGSFESFWRVFDGEFGLRPMEDFSVLTDQVLAGYIYMEEGAAHVFDILYVPSSRVEAVEAALAENEIYSFDMAGLNSAMAASLSDNFNYIGWACGIIVFFFLWISMGHLELAIISFIPMAVSWLWILGIMAVFGIQFNIVNIILATFIFGQGDDYTIFMTEGAMYEYAYRRKILGSYKNSIIVSALIMFVGIGSLIVSKHPALHSLSEVTIVGMFSVVLMAYTLPPLIFKWMVSCRGEFRKRPLSIRGLLVKIFRTEGPEDVSYYRQLVLDRYRYKGIDVYRAVRRSLKGFEDDFEGPRIEVEDSYGGRALLVALLHSDSRVVARVADAEAATILKYSAEGLVDNLVIENQ